MADPRFYHRAGPFRLGAIAESIGGTLTATAHPSLSISDVASLEQAAPQDLSFYDDRRYRAAFQASAAGAVVSSRALLGDGGPDRAAILVDRPAEAFARLARWFYPDESVAPIAHPSAIIDPTARIDPSAVIAAGAVIGRDVAIGERTRIGANATIEANVVIGRDTIVGAGASISFAVIGDRVDLFPGVRIGQAGFGFLRGPDGHFKVPQLGRVVIEDDVTIGSNTTIDRGRLDDTVIGRGAIIDNLVQIAHNVRVGRGCVVIAQAGVSGSTKLGDHVVLAGQVGVTGHLRIGAGARIAAQAGVMRDVDPAEELGGSPAVPVRQWHRQTVALGRLARNKGVVDDG